jgi:hypothetical protein
MSMETAKPTTAMLRRFDSMEGSDIMVLKE